MYARLPLLLGLLISLHGCGQKGPLYLPAAEPPAAAVETPQPETDADGAAQQQEPTEPTAAADDGDR